MGVLYILDEPSIGLHQRDNERLIATLERLRDLGNTVIVVEHDEDTIRAADYVVDIGPGAGEHGGEVVAAGTPAEIMKACSAVAHRPSYLSGAAQASRCPMSAASRQRQVPRARSGRHGEQPAKRRRGDPAGHASPCVTGVSGSGKSSLVNEMLLQGAGGPTLNRAPNRRTGTYRKIEGLEKLDKVIDIDQSPIGRTPRSNPATYTGAVRTTSAMLFASTPEAKARGYSPGRFSFNVKGGRCEACKGDGHDQDRDALPARHLRALRGVQGQALQPRDAGGQLPRQEHLPTCWR